MGDAAQTGTLDALHGRTDEEHALRPQGSTTRPREGGGAEPRGSVGGRGDVGLGGRGEAGEIHVTHKPPCKTRDSHLFPIAACVTISSTCFRIVLVPAQGGPAPCAVTATASRGPDVHSPTSCPRTCMVRAFPVNGAAPCVTSCVSVTERRVFEVHPCRREKPPTWPREWDAGLWARESSASTERPRVLRRPRPPASASHAFPVATTWTASSVGERAPRVRVPEAVHVSCRAGWTARGPRLSTQSRGRAGFPKAWQRPLGRRHPALSDTRRR